MNIKSVKTNYIMILTIMYTFLYMEIIEADKISYYSK